MKILIVTHSYGLNGAAAILKSILRHWAIEQGWTIDVLMNEIEFKQHASELSEIGTRPILQANPNQDYSFVLINTAVNLSYIDLFFKKIPIILWIHEGTTLIQNTRQPPIEIIKALSKPILLIFQTPWQPETVFKSFIHHLPKKRITSIPCGIQADGNPTPRIRTKSNSIKIITIGSVYPRKRQLDLAIAVTNLSRRYEIECSFIGSLKDFDTYGSKGKYFLESYPKILYWMDGVNEDQKLQKINESDISCFPSGDETFGISALETALLGKPVILADLPVYQAVGWIHGKNCLMFPVGDVAALERQLETLLNDQDLQRKISIAGKELAQGYSMAKFFENMTTACLGALNSRNF